MLHLVAERYESPSERIDASKEMEKPHKFHLEFELLMFMDTVRKSGKDLRSEIHNFQCDMNYMTDLMREMLRSAGLDVPPSDQLNFNAAVTDDFDSSSKTQCSKTTAAIHGALKVAEVVDSQEISTLEDGVSGESTIEDSVHVDDAQHFDFTDSNEILSRASTVKHIINEENKQAVEISCVVLGKMADPTNACNVFDEMHEPIPEENLVSIEVTKDAHYLLDKMPTLSPVNKDEGLNGNKCSLSLYPYIVETGRMVNRSSWISSLITNISKATVQELSHMDDVLRVSETNSPPLSKQGFNPQVFDPGTPAIFKQEEYVSHLSDNEGQLHFVCPVLFHFVPNHRSGYIDKVARNLFDNMSEQYSSKQKVGVKGLEQSTSGDWELSLINFTGDLCFKDDDINVASSINSSKIMFGETPVFMFDPSIGSLHLTGSAPHNSSEMPGISPVSPWIYFPLNIVAPKTFFDGLNEVDGLLMFTFDPGVSSWHLTLFGNYYGAGVIVRKGVDFSLRQAQSDVAYGNWYYLTILNHFRMFNSDIHAIISLISDSIVHGDNFSKTFFVGANYKLLCNMLCCWIVSLDRWINELELVSSFGSRIGLLSPRLVYSAWDQGLCAIFAYILEDKDNFKWVGDSILVMVMIRSIRDGQIKIHMKCIQEGFNSMTTWRNGMTCTLTNFIFPGNHVPDKQNEIPKLFNKIIGLSPAGLQFTLFSSLHDYYIEITLRDALDGAPKAVKWLLIEVGEYPSQDRGLGISHQLFDEMAGSFPIKLEICVGPNKELRLSVAAFLKYLGCEGLASVVSSTKFFSKFWLGVISMFAFYPGIGVNEGQWNGYMVIGAVLFGTIDHLVIRRPFDPGGCHSPQIDSDHFEFIVPQKVLDVQVLDALFFLPK